LTVAEKKRILTTHIFGVDIDRQAVEVTNLSLLLKVLDGESDETLQLKLFDADRALPNLDANIKCGNSLIGPDYFDDQLMPDIHEQRRVNAFDWAAEFPEAMKAGGFDCVIGNPPYLFITELDKAEKDYFFERYETSEYRFDVYGLFIELSITKLVKRDGYLSFIIPHTLLSNDSFAKLRKLILGKTFIEKAIDIGPGVFQTARNETMVFVVRNNTPSNEKTQVILTNAKTFPRASKQFTVDQQSWLKNPNHAWLVKVSGDELSIVEKFEGVQDRLGDLCTIHQGLRTGDNEKYLSNAQASGKWKPAAGGKEVGRYEPLTQGLYVYYETSLLDAPRRKEIFESPEKIIVQEIRNTTLRRRLIATYDNEQFYCLQSTNVINLREDKSKGWSIKYLLGILNSNAANFFFRQRFSGNNHIASNQLAKTPVPLAKKAQHDRIVSFVEKMLALHQQLPSAKTAADRDLIQRQIDATDRSIDALVYQLYGLTDDEIKVVERG
jgi:adenine-specific DNA-methyltransferase